MSEKSESKFQNIMSSRTIINQKIKITKLQTLGTQVEKVRIKSRN